MFGLGYHSIRKTRSAQEEHHGGQAHVLGKTQLTEDARVQTDQRHIQQYGQQRVRIVITTHILLGIKSKLPTRQPARDIRQHGEQHIEIEKKIGKEGLTRD